MRRKTLKRKDYVEALEKNFGNIASAAKSLNVSRQQVYRMAQKYPEIQAAVSEGRECIVDIAENAILKLISPPQPKDGSTVLPNAQAVIFTLKTQGKKRGWVERQEITGADGGPIEIAPDELDRRIARLAELGSQGQSSGEPE